MPRTSGLFIRSGVHLAFQTNGLRSAVVYHNKPISQDMFKDVEFISGHLGNYPGLFIKNLKSFSIFRDPVDRFISWFFFLYENSRSFEELENIFDEWLYNPEIYPHLSDMQTKFLTGTVDEERFNNTRSVMDKTMNGWLLKDYSFDESVMQDKVNSVSCYTVETRDILLDDITRYMRNNYGFVPNFDNRYAKFNSSTSKRFDITDKMINRIKELNQHDIILYEMVKRSNPKPL